MKAVAEKPIETRIKGNKITRVNEFKNASKYDWQRLIDDYNDYISDDWEAQLDAGLYCDRNGDIDTIDVTMLVDDLNDKVHNSFFDDDDEFINELIARYEEAFKEFEGFIVSYVDEDIYQEELKND